MHGTAVESLAPMNVTDDIRRKSRYTGLQALLGRKDKAWGMKNRKPAGAAL
jgi:hypothetical protein